MKKRSFLVLGFAVLLGCESGAPERDVFVPPYAEKGCWTRFYGKAGFGSPVRELLGPNFVEARAPLFDDVRGVVVGPHAKIIGYAEPLFRDASVTIGPGSTIPDLGAIEFHERVASFEMLCEAGGAA